MAFNRGTSRPFGRSPQRERHHRVSEVTKDFFNKPEENKTDEKEVEKEEKVEDRKEEVDEKTEKE